MASLGNSPGPMGEGDMLSSAPPSPSQLPLNLVLGGKRVREQQFIRARSFPGPPLLPNPEPSPCPHHWQISCKLKPDHFTPPQTLLWLPILLKIKSQPWPGSYRAVWPVPQGGPPCWIPSSLQPTKLRACTSAFSVWDTMCP